MKLHLSYFTLAASVVVAALSPYYTTKAANCKDYDIIFARGSGTNLGSDAEKAWRSSLTTEFNKTAFSYHFYELGQDTYDDAKYPASGIGFDNIPSIINTMTITLDLVNLGSFSKSINAGVTETIGYLKSVAKTCPNTQFIIGGYSQGAIVTDHALKRIAKDQFLAPRIAYAATFGDPKLYLPEGKGFFPDACRGKNLSRYRIYAPNCRAYSGIVGQNKPYEPSADFAGKVGLWCTRKDLFCSGDLNLLDPMSDHTAYVSMGIYQDAAKQITKKLKKTPTAPPQDVAFLIDTTGSMSDSIDSYADSALRLAKTVLDRGGRIALFEYRDLDDPFSPHKILDFGASYQDLKYALDHLMTLDGGDPPESALSAILFTMNHLNWRKSSLKSIVLLTDDSFHNPDLDGTTITQVVKRSLEIDPVSIFPITTYYATLDYSTLADQTGGKVFRLGNEAEFSTDYLLARPEVYLSLEEYSGHPGEEFTFTALSTDTDLVYDWDLNLDGEFELTNAGPTVTNTYPAETSGFIQVRATNPAGQSSTMSAKLTVANHFETPPTLSNLKLSEPTADHSADLTFKTSGAAFTIISSGDQVLALTSATSAHLTNLPSSFVLSLTPVSASGLRGEPQIISQNAPDFESTPIEISAPDDAPTADEAPDSPDNPNVPDIPVPQSLPLADKIVKAAHSKLREQNLLLPPKCGQK